MCRQGKNDTGFDGKEKSYLEEAFLFFIAIEFLFQYLSIRISNIVGVENQGETLEGRMDIEREKERGDEAGTGVRL